MPGPAGAGAPGPSGSGRGGGGSGSDVGGGFGPGFGGGFAEGFSPDVSRDRSGADREGRRKKKKEEPVEVSDPAPPPISPEERIAQEFLAKRRRGFDRRPRSGSVLQGGGLGGSGSTLITSATLG